ncbi:hypothetical protein F25303_4853 [Fusarium sp. NRRL 25303]|nr:hypothetical protein F25303_4853 [Fusarium sp. NRRL 25303]
MTTSLGTGTEDAISSGSDEEVQTLNPAMLSTSSFPQFSKFPPEVRDKIWIQSVTHERILKIYSEECRIELRERIAMSKLFVTNHESRAAAKRFYRVHIPCTYVHTTSTYDGILYFNPELDIIHVSGPMGAVADIIIPPARSKQTVTWKKIKAAIQRLKRFIFVGVYDSETCQYPENSQRPDRGIASSPFVPVKPHVPVFQTMEQDTRAVGDFLDGVDPDEMLSLSDIVADWFGHEEWGINNDPTLLYQIMTSYPDCDPEIIARENERWAPDLGDQSSGLSTPNSTLSKSVQAVYHREDAIAFAENEMEGKKRILDQILEEDSEVDVEKISREGVTAAFGFWLFPLEALPVVRLDADSRVLTEDFRTELQKQFKKHTPQLCLSHLPADNPNDPQYP